MGGRTQLQPATEFNVVIPTYNEGNNILKITSEILKQSEKHNVETKIHFVNDCSTDELTLKNLDKVSKKHNVFVYKTDENNKGQHKATMLGLLEIGTGTVGVLDCDMQDPVEDLFNMYMQVKDSDCNAIIGVREHNGRKGTDSVFKRVTAVMYYKLISLILRKKVHNSSNFYIVKLDKDNIKKLSTDSLRQSVQDNFNYMTYEYKRVKRKLGKTKYSIFGLTKVALMGMRYSFKKRRKVNEE